MARGPDGHHLPALHAVRRLQQDHCEEELVIYPDFGHEGLPGHSDRVWEFIERFVVGV